MKQHSPLLSSAASISSFLSFDTIRKAPSTAATSAGCSKDQRWSEVVPPESGLTFAVVWDPEDKDILTFSSAELSESSEREPQSPDSPSDAYSQILTINPSIAPTSEYPATATLQFFRENHGSLFPASTDRPTRGRTQTSSTLDGLDVYLRGSMLGRAHNANRYYSCFQDLDDDFSFDPRTSFAKWMNGRKDELRDDVSDEGFFEGGQYSAMDLYQEGNKDGNMSSRFSVTTTSTSNYVTVERDVDDSSDWSALEAPNTPGYSRLLFNPPPSSNRRLRKTRPVTGPACPSAVLNRPEYNHNLPVPPPPDTPRTQPPSRPGTPLPRHLSMPKFARGIGKWKKTDTAGWVWIEVKGQA